MTSWRDSLSAEAQADMDNMLDAALPFAQQMLPKHGEFYPYAVSMSASGEVAMVAADVGKEKAASLDVLALLYEGLASRTQELRAAAIVSDVKLGSGEDAIRVEIEHREGGVLAVVLPYKKSGRNVTYGNLAALPGERRIWRLRPQ
jgi:hypothetical protein